MSWADDLEKLLDKGAVDMAELGVAVKINLFSAVILDTRVDTGRLRGNWSMQNNSFKRVELKTLDKSGRIGIAKIERNVKPGVLTYFVNSLPYAVVYEEEDAMVGRNAARVGKMVDRLAKSL